MNKTDMQQTEQAILIGDLIARSIRDELSDTEQTALNSWISASPANKVLYESVINEEALNKEIALAGNGDVQQAWQRLSAAIDAKNKKPFFRSISFLRVAAAAVLLIIAGTGLYFFLHESPGENNTTVAAPAVEIRPGQDKAILVLSDGSVINLDSAQNGELTSQQTTKVIKQGGTIMYDGSTSDAASVVFNTISTPRGGQYSLQLADGSRVWLNAASSLRFPVQFNGKERKVEITGEAYFEVTKNAEKPFIVSIAGKGEVEVLGTSFNINAYTDEEALNTTLLEGKVKFSTPDGTTVQLTPGQQAILTSKLQVTNADVDEVIAWKTGWFNFNRTDIKGIMRQVSRWYDVDVVFETNPGNKTFSGLVSRTNDIKDVLLIMEKAGVDFKITGKKIVVVQ